MTKRQIAWHRRVSEVLPGVIAIAQAELADRPIGSQCLVRLPPRWGEGRINPVMVLKDSDGLKYREDLPEYIKGITPSIFRPLYLDTVRAQ